ncbi:Ig-like domain-containing protein, partial [Paracoccaceae bacterium]|nr:Ig-like domain-containing protein [Paracoccaceae bacterium]
MAIVFSYESFDQDQIDLHRLWYAHGANFYNDVNQDIYSFVYNDIYEIGWDYGGGSYFSLFGGPEFTVAASGQPIDGTVTGYIEHYWDGSVWQETWGIQDTSIDVSALLNAVETPSTSDDILLINSALSGNDDFRLSNYDDVAYGLGGNDYMRGRDGSDVLHGGDGHDTLEGGAGNDNLYGGIGDDTYLYDFSGIDTISDSGGEFDRVFLTTEDQDGNDTFREAYAENGTIIFESLQNPTNNRLTINNAFGEDSRIEYVTLHSDSGSSSDFTLRLVGPNEVQDSSHNLFIGTRDNDTIYTNDTGPDFVSLSDGDDTVYIGDGGAGVLGGAGDDRIACGSNLDVISYYKGHGNDTLIDFEEGIDKLKYYDFTDAEQAQFVTTTTSDGHTLITHTDGSTILKKSSQVPPTLTTTDSFSISEDAPGSVIAFSATDANGDALTYSFSPPSKGSVKNNYNGTYTYTPDMDENGSDSFTITVSDSKVEVSQTVDVTINAVNDAPSGLVSITGTEQEGSTLTITNSLSDVDGLGVFSYQWLRDGTLISGSTSASYTLAQDDVGAQISVTVSYDDQQGTAESVVSAKTNAIQLGSMVTKEDHFVLPDADHILDLTLIGSGNFYGYGNTNANTIYGNSGDNDIRGFGGDDTLFGGDGADSFLGGEGADTIHLFSSEVWTFPYFAQNIISGERLSLAGKTKFSSVIDGEEDADTLNLTDSIAGDAFFLHDSYSGLHDSLTAVDDGMGRTTVARAISLETINAGAGDDVIDLTSPTFDMGGIGMTINGEAGNDT